MLKILWRGFPYQVENQGVMIETSRNLIKELLGDKEQLHDSQLSLMSNAQANCSVWEYHTGSLRIDNDTYKCKTKL